jgi:hypothetical protein
MRRLARVASLLSPLLLLPATGCWPGIPLAAIAAASGGGGGGGGGANGKVVVKGHIVTDGSAFATSLFADHEPNDRLGTAFEIGPAGAAAPVRFAGSAAATATLHALVDDGARRSIVARELLAADGGTFAADAAAAGTPGHVARIDRELFLLDGAGGGLPPVVRVTPLESGLVKRRFALPGELAPVGFTALLDALLVLDAGNGTTRILAVDPADGAAVMAVDLRESGLAHLAGAEEIASGKPRLFTSAGGRVLEIAIEQDGDDRRFGAVAPAFAPEGLVGGVAALGYDGALVHVVDGAGTLRSYEPDGRVVATRPFVAAGARVVSLVAHCDLGFDGYHVEVPAGARTSVDVRVAGGDGARLFFLALPRGDLESPTAGAPAFQFELTGGTRHAEIDNSAGATPAEYDLVVGARAGAGRYAIALGALGDGRIGPLQDRMAPARDDAARQLGAYLETGLFARLPVARLVEIYRDPLLPDFEPGRIVVGTKDTDTGAAALTVPTVGGFALARDARHPGGYEVWSHRPDATWKGPRVATLHGSRLRASALREESRATLALLARLAGTPGMTWREPVLRVHACSGIASLVTPNDLQFQAQKWAFDEMHVRDAWNITTGDAATVMAIVDTGIRTDNTDLVGNFNGDGFDFVSTNDDDGTPGMDADPFDTAKFFDPLDPQHSDEHHGSHCAGTIGTKGNNTTGLCGINWDCTLMAVRGLGVDGSGSTIDIAQGILYAARLANVSGTLPTTAAAVINLSLGTPSNSNAIHNALKAAINQGCIVCCAAGNDGNGASVLFPAAFPEAIAIAACDIGDGNGNNIQIADYSNTGPEIDLTAPGGSNHNTDVNGDTFVDDIWSTIGNNNIAALAGTSMACSEASGVCGLIKSIDPTMLQGSMRSLLEATATDLDAPGFDQLSGFGLINASAAMPLLSLGADEVDLGVTGNHTLVQAENSGGKGSYLSITNVTQSPVAGKGTLGWLTTTIAGDGKTIVLDADRSVLVSGDHQIKVDVTTNGGSGSFLVDLTQTAVTTPTDVGTVTIQLFASDGTTMGALVTSTKATAADGYAYTLPPVPPGKYFLLAGVDSDNDGVLHEAGELFGAYPRGSASKTLELDHLTSFEIDFVVK